MDQRGVPNRFTPSAAAGPGRQTRPPPGAGVTRDTFATHRVFSWWRGRPAAAAAAEPVLPAKVMHFLQEAAAGARHWRPPGDERRTRRRRKAARRAGQSAAAARRVKVKATRTGRSGVSGDNLSAAS